MKKLISVILLLLLLSPSLSAEQPEPLSSIQRIQQIAQELKTIQQEREIYLQELENINEERKAELAQKLQELKEREEELNKLKRDLELFGNLIDEATTYTKSLQWKLALYKTSTLTLSATTIILLIVVIAKK